MGRLRWLPLLLALALVLVAADISTATLRADVTITNTGTSTVTNTAFPFPLSTQGAQDAGYLSASTLNSQLCSSAVDCTSAEVAFMPSPVDSDWEMCSRFDQTGGAFTDDRTDCTDADASDTPFTISEAGDAFYFGAHHPFRIARINIGTAGSGTWTITWEYCSANTDPATTCDTWTTVPNVQDNTAHFRTTGEQTVSWDIVDMKESTEGGDQSYWARARVSAFTSVTTSPSITQAWYDMGMWWAWVPTIAANTANTYYLFTGGTTSIRTFQHYIPGTAGITTNDTSSAEPGTGNVDIEIKGYFLGTATGSARYIMQKGSVTQYIRYDAATDARVSTQFVYGGNHCSLVATNVTTGQHTLRVELRPGAGTCRILVDGVEANSDTVDVGAAWPDNAANWTWAANGSMAYVEYIKLTISGSTVIHYELNDDFTATRIPDRGAGGGLNEHGTPSFPAIPSNFTATTGSLEATSQPSVAAGVTGSGIAVADVSGDVEGSGFAGNSAIDTDMPWYAFFSQLANTDYDPDTPGTQGLPVRWFYLLVCGMAVIIGMTVALLVTRSLFVCAVVGGLVLAVFVRPANVVEPWALLVYAVLAALAVWGLNRIGVGV